MSKINPQQVIEHLKVKWGDAPCPMCSHKTWDVAIAVFELREYFQGGLVVGGSTILPLIPITCQNCGNTVLINAIIANIPIA